MNIDTHNAIQVEFVSSLSHQNKVEWEMVENKFTIFTVTEIISNTPEFINFEIIGNTPEFINYLV